MRKSQMETPPAQSLLDGDGAKNARLGADSPNTRYQNARNKP
jgi:hypothetical protein